MSFIIENVSSPSVDVEISDLSITVPAGGTYDLTTEQAQDVANSTDLIAAINADDILVLDPLDGVTQLTKAQSLVVAGVANDAHYRIVGGELDQLDDVDAASPTEDSILRFNSTTGKWELETPAEAIPCSGVFQLTFTSEYTAADAWLDSDGRSTNESPQVIPWGCRLAGMTFTNANNSADTDVVVYKTAEGAAASTAAIATTWQVRNARTARKTNYGPTDVTFVAGDKISIWMDDQGTNPSGITVVMYFMITECAGGEVQDEWTGDIPSPPGGGD